MNSKQSGISRRGFLKESLRGTNLTECCVSGMLTGRTINNRR